MKVVKRDGRIVAYDSGKVLNAIASSMKEVEGFVDTKCAREIEEVVRGEVKHNGQLDVEEIQDIVELELMTIYPSIAKAYILYRDRKSKERKKSWELDELQEKIFNSKYRNAGESFDEFIQRVSGNNPDVAKIIRNQDFSFGGRILAGRGLDRNVTLSNCYVLPSPEDNLESIFDTAKYAARTYSYGGGVGFDLSNLRPEGADVNNAALTTSGPISFMDLYDVTTSVIGQKGRRGALMLSMSTDHHDIDKFVNSKRDTDKINHANISVRSNDKFFELDTEPKVATLDAIAQNNWDTGEPGMLFWDRVEDWHLLSHHSEYVLESTNPCGRC